MVPIVNSQGIGLVVGFMNLFKNMEPFPNFNQAPIVYINFAENTPSYI
jgi:hypothetical protein